MRNHRIDEENEIPYPKFTESPVIKCHISELPQHEQDRLMSYHERPRAQFKSVHVSRKGLKR